eukprot:TRINITY_DN1067_c0_g1_i1.p1 TRINITY_DN1067_c0_g1~~TRINITY_DN1067_c0_g1_i1.p1  ORF type:complete len:380 (+),score=84.03 TRINITY_DN1067_c0_g1_i1:63-1202(+)
MAKFKPPGLKYKAAPPPPLPTSKGVAQKINETMELKVKLGNQKGIVSVGRDGVKLEDLSTLTGYENIKRGDLAYVKELGKGTSGTVKLFQDKNTNNLYAVKIVGCSNAETIRKIWTKEIKHLFVQNDFLVSTYSAFAKGQDLFLVQEYMNIGALDAVLKFCSANQHIIPEPVISALAKQILLGLQHLHQKANNISGSGRAQMHRDLKPANVLLNSEGECKLCDFGIVVDINTVGPNTFTGTPEYMSPERIEAKPYSTPADIWAAGVLVAEMGLGKYPFGKGGFMTLLLEITSCKEVEFPESLQRSPELRDFVCSCLKSSMEDRPSVVECLSHPFIEKNSKNPSAVVKEWLETLPFKDGVPDTPSAPVANCCLDDIDIDP